MLEIQRVWRITTSSSGSMEVSLSEDGSGQQRVQLELPSVEASDEQAFDVEVARALAQAMLEACEVASALSGQPARVN
jgi:hypothetical protein